MKPLNFEEIENDPRIKKSILKPSSTDVKPQKGEKVKILYKCRLNDYSIVDECEDRVKGFSFEVAKPGVIEGLNIGIMTMREGERCVFEIPPELAYGESGSGKIPGNETLYFEAELLEIEKNLTEEQKLEAAKTAKNEGNKAFRLKNLEEAINRYEKAITLANDTKDNQLKIDLHNNKALVHLKLGQFSKALVETQETLKIDDKNLKALLRQAKAYYSQKYYEEALKALNIALAIAPEDKEVKTQIQKVQKLKKQHKQKQKGLFSKMFKGNFYEEKKTLEEDEGNVKVFMDIKVGEGEAERVEIELFKNVVPKTVDNFVKLCTEDKGYKGSLFHRLIPNFMIQGGDYTKGDGTGGDSFEGGSFDDENFKIKHKKRGYLSMANKGPNTNGSQFFILFKSTPHLDNKHVVFGRISKNIEILDKLEKIETGEQDKPSQPIQIVDCGLI